MWMAAVHCLVVEPIWQAGRGTMALIMCLMCWALNAHIMF